MKRRTLVLAFLISVLAVAFIPISDAQKIVVPCPSPLTKIEDCPLTGCGTVDPHLNRQKNIDDVSGDAEPKSLKNLRDLPDPVKGFKVGNTREKLAALGEGEKIRVVAFALVARKGGAESCNCKLTSVRDTDNHVVLVDRLLRKKPRETAKALLHRRELNSVTAEFTPRTRLVFPNLTRANLQPLITASGGALKVRITGLLFFDSEHSLGHHLVRHNNWEIHPILALEYCPKPKSKPCTADSDNNWKNLGDQ